MAKASYAVSKGFMMMVGLGGKMNAEAEKDNAAVICSELVALALKHVKKKLTTPFSPLMLILILWRRWQCMMASFQREY